MIKLTGANEIGMELRGNCVSIKKLLMTEILATGNTDRRKKGI
jgi:hypothetical protein